MTFARQIATGQSLTLTDPGMTRYWIAPHHAALLLAYAAGPAFDAPYEALLPDTGPAVPVLTIAQRVWELLHPDVPAGKPAVVTTGLRPGERLHEELTGAGEWLEPSPYPGVLRVGGIAPPGDGTPVAGGIGELLAAIEVGIPAAELKARALGWARSLV